MAIRFAEKLREMGFVAASAAVEPEKVKREYGGGEPRAESEREAGEEDQVAEVHRVARIAIRTGDDEPLGRVREAGATAALAQAEFADEVVLQVTPEEQWRGPRIQARQAALQDSFGGEQRERPDDERAVGRALQPAPHRAKAGA